jgi:hypothetical protein
MARGWESKSVEGQIDELDRRARKPTTPLPKPPHDSERTSLLLQRGRIEALIAASTNPRYIEQQNKALAFLEEKLKAL